MKRKIERISKVVWCGLFLASAVSAQEITIDNIDMNFTRPSGPVEQSNVISKGLTNALPFTLFEFNFNHPGARSTGMGGAFVGLADDATAVITNPAGLTNLYADELSIEVKHQNFENRIGQTENLPSDVTNGTPNYNVDTSDDSLTNVGFLNFAKVTDFGNYSVFYRQPFSYKLEYSSTRGTGQWYTDAGGSYLWNNNGISQQYKSEATANNIGLGGAWALGKDEKVRIGLTIENSTADIDFRTLDFEAGSKTFEGESLLAAKPGQSGPRAFTQIKSDDSDIGFSLGGLAIVSEKLSIGAVYRSGPEYEWQLSTGNSDRSANPTCFEGQVGTSSSRRRGQKCTGTLKTPDVFGFGAAYRVSESLTLVADLRHIKYSQMTKNFTPVVKTDDVRFFDGLFGVDDATEIHVGAEYVMDKGGALIPLRFGYYYEPAHRISLDSEALLTRLSEQNVPFGVGSDGRTETGARRSAGREIAAWSESGEDQHHLTFGVGYVPNDKLQFDFAVNVSDARQEALFSVVKRF